MRYEIVKSLSDISRTNQLKILETPEEVAEKIFRYLFELEKGIECFPLPKYAPKGDEDSKAENSKTDFYQKRHNLIKKEIKKRLESSVQNINCSDIQYFLSSGDREKYVFFLSPNKNHSGWQQLFNNNSSTSNRERILNLVFKFYILSQVLSTETMNGFEELFLVHSKNQTKSKDGLLVWGQNLLIKYNQYDVLTLTLTRKCRLFLSKDKYKIADGDDLGELLVYNRKKYYFKRDLDARRQNSIDFMKFDKDSKNYDKFQKTQLYHYQNLMTKFEGFLQKCNIKFQPLNFQADHYLENAFIKNIESVESLEIINNTGIDLTELDRQFLKNCLKHQGFSSIAFYNSGKPISTYEQIEIEGNDKPCWKIIEVIPWSKIELDKDKNYLIFNKFLDEEAGSMAYQRDDGFWCTSPKIDEQKKIDFYSQLKRRFNYLDTGKFVSTQGINLPDFTALGDNRPKGKKDADNNYDYSFLTYRADKTINVNEIMEEKDAEKWIFFCDKYKIKISPEFQKILIELEIKNWIRRSFIKPDLGLTIIPQSFTEKRFFTIYVRSPKGEKTKAVAVEFIYKDGCIYIQNAMRDLKEIIQRFKFIKLRKNSENLIDNQQYFVDESEQLYLRCYTENFFTPTLIGRNGILEEIEKETLEINRKIDGENSSRLLPLVSYYNTQVKPIKKIQNMLCLDLRNETFIQYYIPPAKSIEKTIKTGFRVYHLIGKKYSGDSEESIPTSQLIECPITALYFSTITQNVLKISDNSQSSLLQKVAQVLIKN